MSEGNSRWPWHRIKTDKEVREAFLRESLPFIRHQACRSCYKNLEWGRDEELSEALLAFNEAIDHFEVEKDVPFLAFARLIIKRRLVDYYRRHQEKVVPLNEDGVGQVVELNVSMSRFDEEEQNKERAAEIHNYAQTLQHFGLELVDIAEVSPKHRDTREILFRAASYIANDQEMWNYVMNKGKIPIHALTLITGIHPKVLERGRQYILAVAIILANQHDYIYLREYVYKT